MTYQIYSQQQLQLKSIARLKQIYSEIACTVEVSDKRSLDSWISAIAEYQATKIQKLAPAAPDEQAAAQAELDHFIADQGSSRGIPKVYPVKDYPIEVYPLKDAPLATPPAPPTHQSVCEKEKLDLTTEEIELEERTPEKPSLKEPTPELPALLSKNSESLQQTDNPSRGSTIAAGSFEKSEQSNKLQLLCPYNTAQNVQELIDAWLIDPTAFSDDFVPLVVGVELAKLS